MSDLSQQPITQAFILCAGLGTRMRPLTDFLPKPLIPLFQEPMIFSILRQYKGLGIKKFFINTHHIPEAWERVFPDGSWEGCSISLVHEPILLDTGGGLRNMKGYVDPNESLLVHNGDVVTTMGLRPLIECFAKNEGSLMTMALRSSGVLNNVGYDHESQLVTDVRHLMGVERGNTEFAGVYCMRPEVFEMIDEGVPVSILPTWLELIGQRKMSGVLLDDGLWFNVGNPQVYLDMHKQLAQTLPADAPEMIGEDAVIDGTSNLMGCTVVGARAAVKGGCTLTDCVVWPDAVVPSGTVAKREVFTR